MVIAIIIIIVGVVSMGALPVAQYPDITPPEIGVTASYTGANAEVVEQSVATPLEQKVNGVENSIYMKSVNSNDGTMNLTVSFEVGADLDMSNVLVQNRKLRPAFLKRSKDWESRSRRSSLFRFC